MRASVVAVLGTLVLGACGGGTPALEFGPMGPLVGSAPGDFRFGVATAATQIEDQNSDTDWYLFTEPTAQGGLGKSPFVGDATGGYTHALDDVPLLSSLHVDSYRFSMEWARIEPRRGVIDEAALQHYSDLLDALVAAHIRPMVTVHHFSNPVWIADPRDPDCKNGPSDTNLCGLGGPAGAMVVQEMASFAQLLATRFGDRVDEWGTVNEPVNYLLAAYGSGSFPPGRQTLSALEAHFIPVVRDYLSAHAAMYKAIKAADTLDADGDGVAAAVGIPLSVAEWVPARNNLVSKNPDDIAGVGRITYVYHHLFPLAVTQGGFDPDLDGTLDEPHPEWANTLDWLGVQYYFRAGVTADLGLIPVVNVTPCFAPYDVGSCVPPLDPTFCVPQMAYEHDPAGLFPILEDLSKTFPGLPLVVTEGGIATDDGGARRSANIVRTLEQIARARHDGIDVRGYYHWSLYDNFEWSLGFAPHFGLYSVDRSTFARTPTSAVATFAAVATTRTVTAAQRTTSGGDGPLPPEPGAPASPELCTSN